MKKSPDQSYLTQCRIKIKQTNVDRSLPTPMCCSHLDNTSIVGSSCTCKHHTPEQSTSTVYKLPTCHQQEWAACHGICHHVWNII